MLASTAAVGAITQFFTFQTDIKDDENAPTIDMFRVHFPRLFTQFMRARQQAENFDVTPLNYLHWPVAVLSVVGLGFAIAP